MKRVKSNLSLTARRSLLWSVLLVPVLGLATSCCPNEACSMPRKSQVLKTMQKANAYFMEKYSDVGADSHVGGKTRPSHIWTRTIYYEGLLAMYSICPDPAYYQYAVDWAESHQWGLYRGPQGRNADNQAAGQIYIDLYRLDLAAKSEGCRTCQNLAETPDSEAGTTCLAGRNCWGDLRRIAETRECLDNLCALEEHGDWTWIDAIQMAMPIFGKMGSLTGEEKYFDKARAMYLSTRNEIGGGLWNAADSLWWRDANFCPPYAEPNGEDCYWSRGNGWVLVALSRYLDELPAEHPHRTLYEADFKAMAAALLPLQRPDGFWNVSLHDPDHFGGPETTGTSLFVAGMAWGIRTGLLEADTYLPAVAKGWKALASVLRKDGTLGLIQSTGKEPKDGQPVSMDRLPDFEDFGLGCYLLAGSQVYQICCN